MGIRETPQVVIASECMQARYVLRHRTFAGNTTEKVSGTYIVDQDAVRKEEMLAGVRFYRTTLLAWEPAEAHDAYQALQELEANHKLMKGHLRLQPCYHCTTSRIEAHIMLTTNCVRHLERLSGCSYKELVDQFKRFKATLIDDGKRLYWQRMELDAAQTAILERLPIAVPPTIWEKWIEVERRGNKSRNKGPSSRKGRSA